ncbi:oligosaccharide flippase family protein [Thermophagus sp. OGC60D27]|uniref:oligosaccharide flippase family protein n=1 Tax=Thermophagus sp. OGC60D27 TaxID=3458415 RepID=UPI00403786EE
MLLSLKKLAGETIIYGASTMIGRLLNWLLMPFYIRTLSTYEYGVVVNLYGVISVLLVILTYGLETGFFRFAGKTKDQHVVYDSLLSLLGITSFLFLILGFFLYDDVSSAYYGGRQDITILLVFIILAIDSFVALPFAQLRLENRPIRFGVIKLVNIGVNIFFNLSFLLFIPFLIKGNYLSDRWVYIYGLFDKVFYVFFSNVLSSFVTLLLLIPFIKLHPNRIKFSIFKPVLLYSLPILFVGITGMITQNIDKILLPTLLGGDGFSQLAIYGANFKIGVLMSLFAQSFRFAFEPFFFKNREKGKEAYAKVMDYFIFFGLCIFLGVTLFIDFLNILLTDIYVSGNLIIPIILLALLFYGIYFNLSLWYKLTDKTWIGALMGGIGAILTVALNILLVPQIGIIGSALALLCGYFFIMIISWGLGQHYYPVPYRPDKYLIYFILGGFFYFVDRMISIESVFFLYLFKGSIFVVFIGSFFVMQRYDKSKVDK